LVFVVLGILATDNSLWLALGLVVLGALVLTWFVFATRAKERAGREPLVSLSLLRNRTSNLGMVTQNAQWLLLSGVSFVVSAYLQVVRGFDAIQTGVIFSATTLALMVSSLAAARLARRTSQRSLILVGFVLTIVGVALLLVMASGSATPWSFVPGLLLIGVGLGTMLTPSVNVAQSSFPDQQQGRDLRGVPQRVQPRLITGHGGRPNDPGRRAHRDAGTLIRPRPRRARRHRSGRPNRGARPASPF
jgi:Na+/melibiose symporter-like transporter